jgi:hypothetical protein
MKYEMDLINSAIKSLVRAMAEIASYKKNVHNKLSLVNTIRDAKKFIEDLEHHVTHHYPTEEKAKI